MEILKSFARFMMLIMVEMDYHSQWKSYEGLGEALKTHNAVAKCI